MKSSKITIDRQGFQTFDVECVVSKINNEPVLVMYEPAGANTSINNLLGGGLIDFKEVMQSQDINPDSRIFEFFNIDSKEFCREWIAENDSLQWREIAVNDDEKIQLLKH